MIIHTILVAVVNDLIMIILVVEVDIEVGKYLYPFICGIFVLFQGNRGGNYRYNSNGNGYQNSAQHQNVRSAPPASSSEQAN